MNLNHAYESDNKNHDDNGYGNGKHMNGSYGNSQVDQYPRSTDLEIALNDREQEKLDKEPLKICVWITERPGTVYGKISHLLFSDFYCGIKTYALFSHFRLAVLL